MISWITKSWHQEGVKVKSEARYWIFLHMCIPRKFSKIEYHHANFLQATSHYKETLQQESS